MKKLHGTPGPLLGGKWAGLRELRRAAPVLLALASASPGLQAQKPEEGFHSRAEVLGWSKLSFGFYRNKLFGQPIRMLA